MRPDGIGAGTRVSQTTRVWDRTVTYGRAQESCGSRRLGWPGSAWPRPALQAPARCPEDPHGRRYRALLVLTSDRASDMPPLMGCWQPAARAARRRVSCVLDLSVKQATSAVSKPVPSVLSAARTGSDLLGVGGRLAAAGTGCGFLTAHGSMAGCPLPSGICACAPAAGLLLQGPRVLCGARRQAPAAYGEPGLDRPV